MKNKPTERKSSMVNIGEVRKIFESSVLALEGILENLPTGGVMDKRAFAAFLPPTKMAVDRLAYLLEKNKDSFQSKAAIAGDFEPKNVR